MKIIFSSISRLFLSYSKFLAALVLSRKILKCQNVRRDNANSGVTGFWGGVLMGLRENLACD